jgi:tRNA dimethylallyltransferase
MTTAATDMRPILIAGPTASGKSGLALRLAEHLGGVVINADSMQVYRELRILTARPSVAAEARAPHALYGHVPGCESYSAGRYAADVTLALDEARRAGRRPIIVGGTGLYFKTLTEGLSPIPAVPDDVRAHWRSEASRKGPLELHAVLAARDREMAERLQPTDTQRVVRALEVLEATGASLAEWQRLPRQPILDLNETIPLAVSIDRDVLAERIDKRFAQMVEEGALDEALQLKALNFDPTLPVMLALGVGPLVRHVAGEITLGEAIEMGAAETRQYAKRQRTWLRGNMIAWIEVSAQEMETSAADFASFIQSAH